MKKRTLTQWNMAVAAIFTVASVASVVTNAHVQTGSKPVVEGLSLYGFGYHSNEAEFAMLDAIPRRLYLASRLIIDIEQGKQHRRCA